MKAVLNVIKPSAKEKQQVKISIKKFIQRLNACLPEAKAILGGSAAKNTWLKGNHDIDIFVQFPLKKFKDKSQELSDLLEPNLKKAFPKKKISRLHGSRDYFQIQQNKLIFEIVPILKITKAEQALNITDISPLHALWIKKHAKKKDEILLAKQFCKASQVYGAESYISGISGYVIEIIVAHYGTFEKFLQAVIKWKDKTIIDPSNFYPKGNVLFHLNKSKSKSPLIVIDPVDKSRNASAALSKEKFLILKKLARSHLSKPKLENFTVKKVTLNSLKKQAKMNYLVYIELNPLKGKKDVVGMKLKKTFIHLKKELKHYGIVKSGWDWDKLWFIVKKYSLPEQYLRIGPPIKMKEAVKQFKKKHKKTFKDNGNIAAKVKEPFPKLDDYIAYKLQAEYVQERVKKINKVMIFP
ncbi:hypothetical protein HOI26_02300 [Candidatus Woesearchaeota archaeon]|nr:hypothetical protein [Candidatus Woesearchaeota archaeon]